MSIVNIEDIDIKLRDLGINRWLLYRSLDRICRAHGFDRATATFHGIVKAALDKARKNTTAIAEKSAIDLLDLTILPRVKHQGFFPLQNYVFVQRNPKTDTTH